MLVYTVELHKIEDPLPDGVLFMWSEGKAQSDDLLKTIDDDGDGKASMDEVRTSCLSIDICMPVQPTTFIDLGQSDVIETSVFIRKIGWCALYHNLVYVVITQIKVGVTLYISAQLQVKVVTSKTSKTTLNRSRKCIVYVSIFKK